MVIFECANVSDILEVLSISIEISILVAGKLGVRLGSATVVAYDTFLVRLVPKSDGILVEPLEIVCTSERSRVSD